MIDWLRDNYGWKAKRTEYTWLVAVLGLIVLVGMFGPVVADWLGDL